MNRAVFLDRDGVVNELVYYREQGLLDSPATVAQFKMFSGAAGAIKKLSRAGYKVIIVSNQPGIAKKHHSRATFEEIRRKMHDELKQSDADIDGEYYCFHHPEAAVASLRTNCICRKPKPGLLMQAAREMDLDLPQSWMVGDGLTDIRAGQSAGCKTLLLGTMKCELCQIIDTEDARPDFIAVNLNHAADIILDMEGKHGDIH